MAGSLMTAAARERGVPLLPVDSEHSAVFQCLEGHNRAEVHRILLTASGGPFRTMKAADLAKVTVEEALNHPTWRMGAKITVDSATLMNKGLEVIEARWLFDLPPEQVQVVVHPQSIVHSHGRVRGRLGHRPARRGRHGHPDPLRADVSRSACPVRRSAWISPGSGRSPSRSRTSSASRAWTWRGRPCSRAAARRSSSTRPTRSRSPRSSKAASAFTQIPELIAEALARVPARALDSIDTCVDVDTRTRGGGAGLAARRGRGRDEIGSLMATVQMLVSFVVVLGILIIVHELGHFIVARLCGVGVERFSVGFGPVLWRFRGKETEYCLSADPDGRLREDDGRRREPARGRQGGHDGSGQAFNGKPLAARFLIVFAGPAMNFVLAVAHRRARCSCSSAGRWRPPRSGA